MKTNIKETYLQNVEKYTSMISSLKHKNTGFITTELLFFSGFVALLIAFIATDVNSSIYLAGSICCLACYLLVRHVDDKYKEKIEYLSALLRVYQDEIKASEGDFTPFETGVQFQDPHHPYAFDLDVFGKDSLYNRICRTTTTGGSDALAHFLSLETPLDLTEIKKYAELQKELANQDENWRIDFLAIGKRNNTQKISSSAVFNAIQKVSTTNIPTWFDAKLSLFMGWLMIITLITTVFLAIFNIISADIPLWWGITQYMVAFFLCKQTLDKIANNGGKLSEQLIAYSQILSLINKRQFQSELGKEMQSSLAKALPSFTQLEKILKEYDRRGNFLGLFITDTFLLSDFFLVRKFLRWKKTYVIKMEEWIHIVSKMDAMVSMADYRFNHPEATEPVFTNNQEIVFEAKNLYHPFLGDNAIKNDFTIKDGNYYIITGANMAGKSTFLRSLGINYLLAMSGMSVFADYFKLSRFRIFSSMRTSDDLTHGISYFNAELIRLEQLLHFCKNCETEQLRTLIILDEILKGTNSLDKLNGSRRFLEAITQLPVSGIIATHDLELSKMEEKQPSIFHNYCFEIDLGTEVTYTYKIKRGVARNQNATFLLNKILEKY